MTDSDWGSVEIHSTIEFYHELLVDPHNFFLTGYWGSGGVTPKPKIIKWVEVDPFGPR